MKDGMRSGVSGMRWHTLAAFGGSESAEEPKLNMMLLQVKTNQRREHFRLLQLTGPRALQRLALGVCAPQHSPMLSAWRLAIEGDL